jgi:hypothetical protein
MRVQCHKSRSGNITRNFSAFLTLSHNSKRDRRRPKNLKAQSKNAKGIGQGAERGRLEAKRHGAERKELKAER